MPLLTWPPAKWAHTGASSLRKIRLEQHSHIANRRVARHSAKRERSGRRNQELSGAAQAKAPFLQRRKVKNLKKKVSSGAPKHKYFPEQNKRRRRQGYQLSKNCRQGLECTKKLKFLPRLLKTRAITQKVLKSFPCVSRSTKWAFFGRQSGPAVRDTRQQESLHD